MYINDKCISLLYDNAGRVDLANYFRLFNFAQSVLSDTLLVSLHLFAVLWTFSAIVLQGNFVCSDLINKGKYIFIKVFKFYRCILSLSILQPTEDRDI